MLVDTGKLIPVTKLQRELTQKLKEVSETGEPVYVLRNNEMAAVIVSAEEYELLTQAEEVLEHLEIAEKIDKRLKGHDRSKNIPWGKIKRRMGALLYDYQALIINYFLSDKFFEPFSINPWVTKESIIEKTYFS
jgi:prevent-host-death family protein